jgi:hypothetical protein
MSQDGEKEVGDDLGSVGDERSVSEPSLTSSADDARPVAEDGPKNEDGLKNEDDPEKSATRPRLDDSYRKLVIGSLVLGTSAFLVCAFFTVTLFLTSSANRVSLLAGAGGKELDIKDPSIREIDVGLTVSDSDQNCDITVQRVLDNIPFDSNLDLYKTDKGVAIEVKISNQGDFAAVDASRLWLLADGGVSRSSKEHFDEFVDQYGLEELAPVEKGRTASGWLFFAIKKSPDSLVFRYARPEMNISSSSRGDTGKNIPAKNFNLDLGFGSD